MQCLNPLAKISFVLSTLCFFGISSQAQTGPDGKSPSKELGEFCQSDAECKQGSCQPNYGLKSCLLKPGEAMPADQVNDVNNWLLTTTHMTYVDHGVTRAAYPVGADCSDNPNKCGIPETCVKGVCKRFVGCLGGFCESDRECAFGTCQPISEDRSYCFLKDGEAIPPGVLAHEKQLREFCGRVSFPEDIPQRQYTTAEGSCFSYGTVDDHGTLRCAYRYGSKCNVKNDLCYGQCVNGKCKKRINEHCNDSSECAVGGCHDNGFGFVQMCKYNPGDILPKDANGIDCASMVPGHDSYTYEDNGVRRCKYPKGSDCSKNKEICAGRCVNGTCQ